jgi:hypothetical protein
VISLHVTCGRVLCDMLACVVVDASSGHNGCMEILGFADPSFIKNHKNAFEQSPYHLGFGAL